jgi:hypothetical protein
MYEDSLLAMEYLLRKVGENHWLKWIQKDLEDWRKSKSVRHHLSAYGGMGSFNDVVICKANNYSIPTGTEDWVDPLFNWIKSLCYFLAKNPNKDFSMSELKKGIGYHDASLSAFVGGDKAPQEMRGLFENKPPIQGWRCLECGYSELSDSDVNYYVAQSLLPEIVFQACINKSLIEMIDSVLRLNIPNLSSVLNKIKSSIDNSGITLTNREGWMRPCPSCSSENTAVYRWLYSNEKFLPSEDNLKVKATSRKWWQFY